MKRFFFFYTFLFLIINYDRESSNKKRNFKVTFVVETVTMQIISFAHDCLLKFDRQPSLLLDDLLYFTFFLKKNKS